jgi:hypothetical protein
MHTECRCGNRAGDVKQIRAKPHKLNPNTIKYRVPVWRRAGDVYNNDELNY